MRNVLLRIFLAAFLSIAFWGCTSGGGGDGDPGEKAEIPTTAEIIVFAGGAGWGDVVFTHATHADEYYDGVCIHCHDHETVGTESHWSCRECHTTGQDAEALCEEYANHGCIMTQCQDCHLQEGGNPAPDGDSCGDCHGSPEYAETIVFSGGGGYGPVGFTHMKHSTDYYDGDCMECHDHDEGVWVCGDCHTRGADAEELCVEKEDHGCIMTQCQYCHAANSPPAPDGDACGDCHGFPPYAETIVFPGGGNCESVTFTHQKHAMDYSEGRCRDCHKMEADFWMCRLCHTVGGVGGENDANCEISQYFDAYHEAYHGCIAYQCMQCHAENPEAPDGSLCVHCHDSCDCPPPDQCECSNCHTSHDQDPCTDCHAYASHTSWQPCTNDVCHAIRPPASHSSWTPCTTALCHAQFPLSHQEQTCNGADCHSFPPPGDHNYDGGGNDGCTALLVCHLPGTYKAPSHKDNDDCMYCHQSPPHDMVYPWASCTSGGCHGTLSTSASHNQKPCNDTDCHIASSSEHDLYQVQDCTTGVCHEYGDHSGVLFDWDPCSTDVCHPVPPS